MNGCVPSSGQPTTLPDRRQRRPSGLFAEESVLRIGGGETTLDQQFGVEVGFARHVLYALALDRQGLAAAKVAQSEIASLADKQGERTRNVTKFRTYPFSILLPRK